MLYERKNFESMTGRKYEYINGLNGHFEIALYADTFEEVDKRFFQQTLSKVNFNLVFIAQTELVF